MGILVGMQLVLANFYNCCVYVVILVSDLF